MGGNDQDINITIKAKDEATAAIEKLTAKVEELTKKLGDVSKASDSVTESQKKSATSGENLTASVFKGVAAWDMLKKGIAVATDFMKDSTEAFLDAQKKVDLTRATVESMGQSFVTVKPRLDAFGESMAKMGTDDEDAALAAAKLAKAVGGDLKQGMQLAKLAADLTSSGFNDFEGNVDNLSKVISGKGQRALMDYKINMDDNATTAEQLAAIQDKVTQTTEQYANTIPGKIATVKAAYDNLKESIGGGFVTAITSALDSTNGFNDAMGTMQSVTKNVGPVIFSLTSMAIALAEGFVITGQAIAAAGLALNNFSKIRKGDAVAIAEVNAAVDQVTETFKDLKATLNNVINPVDGYNKAMEAVNTTTKKNEEASKQMSVSLSGVSNSNTAAGGSADKLKGKYKDLGDALTKLRQTAVDEMAALEKAHDSAVTGSQAKISELRKSLNDLTDEYNRSAAAAQRAFDTQAKQDDAGVGEAIVAQQKKIADLKKQAGLETDPQARINLLDQLAKEQAAYDSQAEFITSKSAEVTEAQRRDKLTDFERAIEDYKAKRVQAEQEFNDNRADAAREYSAKQAEIKLQLASEQAKLDQENANYKKAHDIMTKIRIDAENMRLDVTKQSADAVIKLVDAQIDRYNKLADAIQRASQGKPIQVTSASIPVREHGGIVPGPVGTAVPIIAHGQERIVPASQTKDTGGGGVISITINNPTVRSDNDLANMRQMIEDAFRDVSRVHKLTTI